MKQYTDENGIWEWDAAPLDEFQVDICRPDGMQLLSQTLIAREEEYVFTPPKALFVSGSVVDANTKELIEKFRVVAGYRNGSSPGNRTSWIQRGGRYEPAGGKYGLRMTSDGNFL